MTQSSLLIFTFLSSCIFSAYGGEPQMISCRKPINSCSCETDKGIIDLSPLVGNPQFSDVADSTGIDSYSYNPCKDFTEGDCKDVAVCQIQGGLPPSYFNLGHQASATFVLDQTRGLEIQYSEDSVDNTLRTSFVQLMCDPNVEHDFEVKGEDPPTSANYYLALTSKYCCPKGSGPTGPGPTDKPGPGGGGSSSSSSLSVGSILLIVLVNLLVVYIVVGVMVQKFMLKKSGRESLPHTGFWASLPVLVKDGALFVVRRGRAGKYDEI